MSNFVFNQALGRMAYYASLPAVSDALVVVPLELSGIETDAVLRRKATFADVVAGTTNEQTTVGRQTLSNVVVTVDNTNDRVSVKADSVVYSSPSGNAVGAFVICYDGDTGSGTDANLVPLVKAGTTWTPDGIAFTLDLTGDFYRSTSLG